MTRTKKKKHILAGISYMHFNWTAKTPRVYYVAQKYYIWSTCLGQVWWNNPNSNQFLRTARHPSIVIWQISFLFLHQGLAGKKKNTSKECGQRRERAGRAVNNKGHFISPPRGTKKKKKMKKTFTHMNPLQQKKRTTLFPFFFSPACLFSLKKTA